ncbi:hypothetical protein HK096_003767 [Nowakowskiella sp. JEL0078]|nr:hypothetical protein HK096_003767 [Nowakowskiella sp. JEL0078]
MDSSFFTQSYEDLYEILGIDRAADEEQIKKVVIVFVRMALRFHPDKRGAQDLDASEKFQKIQHAYSILSDPKKRKVYDEYGEAGVKMTEQLGDVPYELLGRINLIFFVLTLVVALLIVFPALVSGKADGSLSWPWVAVFSPIFLVDLFIIISISTVAKRGDGNDDNEDDNGFPEDREANSEQRENRKKDIKKRTYTVVASLLAYYLVFCMFQILIALRLDNVRLPWWGVFIPWFILEAVHLVTGTMGFIAKIKTGVPIISPAEGTENMSIRPLTSSEKVDALISTYAFWVFRIVQAALLISKADGSVIDWRLVFIPSYIYGVWTFLSVLWILVSSRYVSEPGLRSELFASFLRGIISFFIFGTLIYTGLGLLIARLYNDENELPEHLPHHPSALTIAIPLFIVLAYEAELAKAKNSVVIGEIPVSRRIEFDAETATASSSFRR